MLNQKRVELLDILENFLEQLDRHNVKLHPGKFVLFAKELGVYSGEVSSLVSKDRVKPPPYRLRLAAIREMPEPNTQGESPP